MVKHCWVKDGDSMVLPWKVPVFSRSNLVQLCPRTLRSDITIFSALGFMGMACAKLLVGPRLDKQKLIWAPLRRSDSLRERGKKGSGLGNSLNFWWSEVVFCVSDFVTAILYLFHLTSYKPLKRFEGHPLGMDWSHQSECHFWTHPLAIESGNPCTIWGCEWPHGGSQRPGRAGQIQRGCLRLQGPGFGRCQRMCSWLLSMFQLL